MGRGPDSGRTSRVPGSSTSTRLPARWRLSSARVAVFEARYRDSLLLMMFATWVDATDGLLARQARVTEVLQTFDGARLDDIVDYLTFVFLPVLFMYHGALMPYGWDWLVASVVLLSSAYGFAIDRCEDERSLLHRIPVVLEHRRPLSLRRGSSAAGQRDDPPRVERARVRQDRLRVSVSHARLADGDRDRRRRVGCASFWRSSSHCRSVAPVSWLSRSHIPSTTSPCRSHCSYAARLSRS